MNDYNREINNEKHVKFFSGLQFLNPHEVGDWFDFGDDDSKVLEFQDYLVDNYIRENELNLRHIWVCFSRTTNTVNLCIPSLKS